MRLSEAIRLGAAMKPQGFNGLDIDRTCALRAATEAVGIKDNSGFINYRKLSEMFDVLGKPSKCPVCSADSQYIDILESIVYHLNDGHRWTREHIADWIELNHEPLPEPTPVEEQEPQHVGI